MNIQTNADLTLTAPGGQVCTMSTTNEMLLAGVHVNSSTMFELADLCIFSYSCVFVRATVLVSSKSSFTVALSNFFVLFFTSAQDGSILAWTFNSGTNSFEATASLKGHTGSVVSLVFGAGRLYSGSMDKTIRVWDLENMQCIHTLNKHSEVVMSLVCWDQYLLSCSLDQTLKVPPFVL